jgi:hypothetical protein
MSGLLDFEIEPGRAVLLTDKHGVYGRDKWNLPMRAPSWRSMSLGDIPF